MARRAIPAADPRYCHRRFGALLLAVLLVVVLAGCETFGPRFELRFPARDHIQALTVVVVDRVGIVRGVTNGPEDAREGIAAVADRDDQLVVTWLGGACDHGTTLTLEAAANGYTITERTEPASGCLLIGVGRSVVLWLAQPVAPESVRFIPTRAEIGRGKAYRAGAGPSWLPTSAAHFGLPASA